jgi:hypothetical protein
VRLRWGAPEAEAVGTGGGFERGEGGALAVLLVVPGAAGGDHLGVDVLAGEHDGADDLSIPSARLRHAGGQGGQSLARLSPVPRPTFDVEIPSKICGKLSRPTDPRLLIELIGGSRSER